MNFIEAVKDKGLLGTWTKRFDLSSWLVFHAAIDGLPIDPANLGLFARCTGRTTFPTIRAVEVYGEIGRRGGKSANIALRAVYECAIHTEWRDHLAPGQQAIFAIVSVDRQAAREVFNYVSGILHSTPLLESMVAAEGKEEIELNNGAIIQIRTASFRSVRGPAYIGAVLDELAFFRDADSSANPASEIIAAISPAIIPGGIIFGISSVFNRQGVLWDTHQQFFGKDGDVLIWHADTLTMNPTFSQNKIQREKAKDQARASAEYDSLWRDDVMGLYSAENIDAAMHDRGDIPFMSGVKYLAFVDPSGGRRDSAALAIAHRDKSGRIVLDVAVERKAPHDPGEVVQEFSTLLQAYGLKEVVGDRYGGEWPVAAYKKQGIKYSPAEMTASELYLAALPLFSGNLIDLPKSDRLRNQLCGLLRRTSGGGKDSVLAGQGDSSHSDLANAAIGAVNLAVQDQQHHGVVLMSDRYLYGPNAGMRDSDLGDRSRHSTAWDVIPSSSTKQVILMGDLPKK